MEASIKDVCKLEGEGSGFVEICRLLEIKIYRHGGGGGLVKIANATTTNFREFPYTRHAEALILSFSEGTKATV